MLIYPQHKCLSDLRASLLDRDLLAPKALRLLLHPPIRARLLPIRLSRRLVRATMAKRFNHTLGDGIFVSERQLNAHGSPDGDGGDGGHCDQWNWRLARKCSNGRGQEESWRWRPECGC